MPENKPNREDAAADALIAYSLAHFNPDHLSDEEILESSSGTLSDEAREALRKFKPRGNPLASSSTQHHEVRELAGMYRAGSDENLSDALKEEIKRKRAELRERLKRKQQGDV
jgi:hypothetical protein